MVYIAACDFRIHILKNMALTICGECGGQLSDTANTCPHCGGVGPAQIAYQMAQRDWADCQQQAIAAGALEPQDFAEKIAAAHIATQGQSWANTPRARSRLQQWSLELMRKKGYAV